MHTRFALSSLIAGSLAAGGLIIGAAASAADAPPGVRWRQTQSMEMMGMSMPARTTEFCQEAGSNDLPIKPDKNCTMHDVKRTPEGATFRMSCTGENAFEADGDMVFLGPDHTRSTMRGRMEEGEMTMKSESQKLGPCTGSESNLQVRKMAAKAQADAAAAQAEATRKQAQMCAEGARKAENPQLLLQQCKDPETKKMIAKAQADAAAAQAEAARRQAQMCAEEARKAENPQLLLQQCKDPETKKTYCSAFQTHEAFRKQAEYEARMSSSGAVGEQAAPLSTSAKLCAVDVAQLRKKLCDTAEAQGQMAFIATQCIALAARIAARECSGRSYTSVAGSPYYPICASVAAAPAGTPGTPGVGNATPPPPPPPTPVEAPRKPKSDTVSKGRKILGDLLGN